MYGPEEMRKTERMCRAQKFGLMCDESTDQGINSNKYLVILVRLYDKEVSKPVTRFLDLIPCNTGTADDIFKTIELKLR